MHEVRQDRGAHQRSDDVDLGRIQRQQHRRCQADEDQREGPSQHLEVELRLEQRLEEVSIVVACTT